MGQTAVRGFFIILNARQQIVRFWLRKDLSPLMQRAITHDFIMLDGLAAADNHRVFGDRPLGLSNTLSHSLISPSIASHFSPFGSLPTALKTLSRVFYVVFGFLEMVLEWRFQLVTGHRGDHVWSRFGDSTLARNRCHAVCVRTRRQAFSFLSPVAIWIGSPTTGKWPGCVQHHVSPIRHELLIGSAHPHNFGLIRLTCRCLGVKLLPASLFVLTAPVLRIDGLMPIETTINFVGGFCGGHRHERAAATYGFGINVGISFRCDCIDQCPDSAASRRACDCDNSCRGEPTNGDNRP
jgi:hypothetical protein